MVLTPYKCMMLKQFADRKFIANGIDFEEQRRMAYSLMASYDLFISQCMEKNFTPTFYLYTLWKDCQSDSATVEKMNAN